MLPCWCDANLQTLARVRKYWLVDRAWILLFLIFVVPSVLCEEEQQPKIYFFVTVDTETSAGCTRSGCFPESIADRILGQRGDKYYGIPLMMDILERHGMKGTFFINAYLDSYYPEAEVEQVVRQIVDRGHDVQLHTHEEFRCFSFCDKKDIDCWNRCTKTQSYMSGNTLENQIEIISEGALNIEKWSGRYPVAFRGGGFDADVNTLKALRVLNIPVDSSLYNPGHQLATKLPVNKVGEYEGIVEVPLFNYTEDLILKRLPRVLDIESNTLLEQKYLLNEAIKNGIRTAVLLMHSFSFCRPGYGCPIEKNIERFDNLLAYIKTVPDIKVMTFREFWDMYQASPETFLGESHIPRTKYFHTLHRSFVRFDQGLKNKLFLLGNVAVIIGLTSIMVIFGVKWFRLRRYRQA